MGPEVPLSAVSAVSLFIESYKRADVMRHDFDARNLMSNILIQYVFNDPEKHLKMADEREHKLLAAIQIAFCEGYRCGMRKRD